MNKVQVTCFGEILWDVFPTHKVIGGAPLNVALRLQSLGVHTEMISSIGNDENGKKAIDFLANNTLNTAYIQTDTILATGHVVVTLDSKGAASYQIFKPVAWDAIKANSQLLELVSNSEIFVFGSLVCREKVSKETLLKLIEKAHYKVFDVNLRPPDYSTDVIFQLMKKADFIKMNDEELHEIYYNFTESMSTLEEQIELISKRTNTNTICITKGGDGAVLFHDGQFFYNKGYKVIVEDTVGAGDSFLASLIAKFLVEKNNPQDAIDFACAVGSLVASKKGANSEIFSSEIVQLLKT